MTKDETQGTKIPDRKQPETIDGTTGKPDDTLPEGNYGTTGANGRRIDLANLRDVRLEMARVYRMTDAGALASQEGARRVYMLRQIHDVIVSAELESRINELEDHIEQQRRLGNRPSLPH